MINIIGANGKIGKLLVKKLKGKNIRINKYNRIGYKIEQARTSNRKEGIVNIDFSNSSNTKGLIKLTYRRKAYLIIGTTGIRKREIKTIKKISRCRPIFISNNFNLGFNIFVKALKKIKKIIPYKCQLIETHHSYKLDIPSGSSKVIKNSIGNIPILSLRYGNVIGRHKVLFYNRDNTITVTHNSENRRCFINIIPYILKFIIRRNKGLFKIKI
ncbi:dihydrodipicolinate reductase C-terminal domain-containing protein [Candidatus Vidania fulgoroideorum]